MLSNSVEPALVAEHCPAMESFVIAQENLDCRTIQVAFEVRVRLCEDKDLRALEWEGMFRSHRKIIKRAFERQLRGDNLMLLAEGNGKPVGQVWLDLAIHRKEHLAYLWAMRVVPWFQGLGIGGWLLMCAEEFASGLGFKGMALLVAQSNPDAKRLYERAGFTETGRVELREPYKTKAGKTVQLRRQHIRMEKLFGTDLEQAANGQSAMRSVQPSPATLPSLCL